MIDLAKQLNNDPTMIRLTQIFVQQPRNSPDSLSVQYCQQAPKNAELNGLFQCQFQGATWHSLSGMCLSAGLGRFHSDMVLRSVRLEVALRILLDRSPVARN